VWSVVGAGGPPSPSAEVLSSKDHQPAKVRQPRGRGPGGMDKISPVGKTHAWVVEHPKKPTYRPRPPRGGGGNLTLLVLPRITCTMTSYLLAPPCFGTQVDPCFGFTFLLLGGGKYSFRAYLPS